MNQEVSDQVNALSDRLGNPGVAKLFAAAKKANINVSRKQVTEFVGRQGQRQVFMPVQPSKGKSASEGVDARFQLDLIDFKSDPRGGQKNAVALVNVFTRQLYARPVRSKEPDIVAPVLRQLLNDLEVPPDRTMIISSDAGNEFTGAVDTLLRQRNIIHKVKPKGEINSLAIADRAIQTLKQKMAHMMAKDEGDGNWTKYLRDAVAAYNAQYHSAVMESPEDVRKHNDVIFMNMKNNAEKIRHNSELLEERKIKLEKLGAFRKPISTTVHKFKRNFHAVYGEKEKSASIKNTQVKAEDGSEINIKMIMPVDKESSKAAPSFMQNTAMQERKRERYWPIAHELWNWLNNDTRALTLVAKHLKANVEAYEETMRGTHLIDVIRLFENMFELPNNFFVRRA